MMVAAVTGRANANPPHWNAYLIGWTESQVRPPTTATNISTSATMADAFRYRTMIGRKGDPLCRRRV